jgi:uncharacterized membrane protein YfcA
MAAVMEFIDAGLGMGYGTVLSPLLIIMGFNPIVVVPAVLLSQALGGFTASRFHHKLKNADFTLGKKDLKIVFLITVLGIVATVIGAIVGIKVSKSFMQNYIGILVLVTGSVMLLRSEFSFSWFKMVIVGVVSSFNKGMCYDKNTEILTKEDGWILFKDLTSNHNVACLSDKKTFYWNKPSSLQKYRYNGEMIHIKTRSADIMVTPNHSIYVREQNSKKYELIKAENLNHYAYNLLQQVGWDGEEKEWFELPKIDYDVKCNGQFEQKEKLKMDDWLEFFAWYISDGFIINNNSDYPVCITQIDEKNLNRIKNCIERLGYKTFYNVKDFRIYNKQLYMYLSQFGKCDKKYIPQEILNLSKRQLKIFIDTLMLGDGHIGKNGIMTYYSSSKKLIGQIPEIAIKLGYSCSISERDRRGESHLSKRGVIRTKLIGYVAYIKISKESFFKKTNIAKESYSDYVYCCTVPEHIILTKRNGKIAWCGNSGGGFGPIVTGGQIIAGNENKSSIGCTTFAEAPICIASFLTYLIIRGIEGWDMVLFMCVGAVIGAPIGAMLTSKMNSKLLRNLLGMLIFALGFWVLVGGKA